MITEKELASWYYHINSYRLPYAKHIKENIELKGIGIELGAGTCWFSSVLSSSQNIDKIFAIDIDPRKLDLAEKYFIPAYNGLPEKIKIIEADYHSLPLENSTIDFVIIDAALHHTNDLEKLLIEIKRVLKPDGIIVAIREPILPCIEPLKTYRKINFGRKEKLKGDIEKIYAKEEWIEMFDKSGFSLEIKEFFPNTTLKEKLLKHLRVFNGYLFNRHYMIAKIKR